MIKEGKFEQIKEVGDIFDSIGLRDLDNTCACIDFIFNESINVNEWINLLEIERQEKLSTENFKSFLKKYNIDQLNAICKNYNHKNFSKINAKMSPEEIENVLYCGKNIDIKEMKQRDLEGLERLIEANTIPLSNEVKSNIKKVIKNIKKSEEIEK